MNDLLIKLKNLDFICTLCNTYCNNLIKTDSKYAGHGLVKQYYCNCLATRIFFEEKLIHSSYEFIFKSENKRYHLAYFFSNNVTYEYNDNITINNYCFIDRKTNEISNDIKVHLLLK